MSMILGLVTLGDTNISRVLADPPLIWKVIAPDDPEIYAQAREDTLGSLIEYYRILRGFLHQAVDGEFGMVVYLS